MNLIVGILIGTMSPSWTMRIIIPFLWALVFVGYKWIRTRIKFDRKVIIVEYTTAAITALVLSILTGSLLEIISRLH